MASTANRIEGIKHTYVEDDGYPHHVFEFGNGKRLRVEAHVPGESEPYYAMSTRPTEEIVMDDVLARAEAAFAEADRLSTPIGDVSCMVFASTGAGSMQYDVERPLVASDFTEDYGDGRSIGAIRLNSTLADFYIGPDENLVGAVFSPLNNPRHPAFKFMLQAIAPETVDLVPQFTSMVLELANFNDPRKVE